MFKYFKQGKYRKEVFPWMRPFLRMYPKGVGQITADYPGILTAVDHHFEQKTPPIEAAIYVSTAFMTSLISSLSLDQRRVIKNQVNTLIQYSIHQRFHNNNNAR